MQPLKPHKPNQDKHLSQSALVPDILTILKNEGGIASKKIVEEKVYQMHKDEFVKPWYNQLVSRAIPRWKHNVAWAKQIAVQAGWIMRPAESGRGKWQLTVKGYNFNLEMRKVTNIEQVIKIEIDHSNLNIDPKQLKELFDEHIERISFYWWYKLSFNTSGYTYGDAMWLMRPQHRKYPGYSKSLNEAWERVPVDTDPLGFHLFPDIRFREDERENRLFYLLFLRDDRLGKMNNWLKENTHTIPVKHHPFWSKEEKMVEIEMFNKSHRSFDDWKDEVFA